MIKPEDKMDTDANSASKVTADQVLKLATLTDINQILMSIKLAYFPFAGFVFKEPDAEGLKILYEYSEVFLKIHNYLFKKDELLEKQN